MLSRIRVQQENFDCEAERRILCSQRKDIGAVASFLGLCRDENGALSALELEHYPGMAEEEIAQVVEEAARRWPLLGVCAIHRYGKIAPGEEIVLVIACAGHRQAAFAGASFIMDFLKTRAPFWKKNHLAAGGDGGWVDAREEDFDALEKWSQADSVRDRVR